MLRFIVARLIFAWVLFRGCKYWYILHWFISVEGEVLIISSRIIFVAIKHMLMVFIVFMLEKENLYLQHYVKFDKLTEISITSLFFWHNYLSSGRNQLFCQKKSTFDELHVKKTSSNSANFLKIKCTWYNLKLCVRVF